MIEDAISYPTKGDDAPRRLLIGGVIYLASGVIGFFAAVLSVLPLVGLILGPLGAVLAFVPNVLIAGYSVSVCRSVIEGWDGPPAFDHWKRLLTDGLTVLAIGLLYALPVVVLGVGAMALFLLVSFVFGQASDVTGVASLLIFSLGSLVAALYGLTVAYVMPAAIFNYARTDSVSSAWDVGTLRSVATNVEYAKAWAAGLLFLFVANVVGSSLTILLVGFVLFFYGQVAAMYLYANGAMDALDMTPAGPTADDGVAGESGAGEGADGEEPAAGEGGDVGEEPGAEDADGEEPAAGEGAVGEESAGEDEDAGEESDAAPAGESGRDLEDVTGIGPTTADSLRGAGYGSVEDLRTASRSDLAEVEGIGPAKADRIKNDVDGE